MKTIEIQTDRQILRKVHTVSDITRDIRLVLEQNFSGVWVEGEVSNFKFHTSGHMYFSLKDEAAQIQCVMFRRENQALDFEPKEGLAVLCYGRVSVYPVRGQYQLYIERMEPKGIGALQLKFQQLKEKLRREGLFDEARKREIPFLPRRIGIITSIDGAALRDILQVLDRRFSTAHLLIYPVPVQGGGAAPAIAEAVEDMNRWRAAQVLILARGGGSLEDLWAFNEEITARAIFNSRIPVISAVGHETDFTIADFVADLRAPTPSAAAEIVMPLKEDLLLRISDSKERLFQAVPRLLKTQFQKLDELKKNLKYFFVTFVKYKREKLSSLVGKLDALGPLATLKRGFSVTLKLPEGKIVMNSSQVKAGDNLRIRVSKGTILSQVKQTRNK